MPVRICCLYLVHVCGADFLYLPKFNISFLCSASISCFAGQENGYIFNKPNKLHSYRYMNIHMKDRQPMYFLDMRIDKHLTTQLLPLMWMCECWMIYIENKFIFTKPHITDVTDVYYINHIYYRCKKCILQMISTQCV